LSGPSCQYDPFSGVRNDCERYQELFARLGVLHTRTEGELWVSIGGQAIDGYQPDAVQAALAAAGRPLAADPAAVNHAAIVGLLLVLVVALAAITGPQTATLAELFPARTRYSAVALPHNLSAGWIGGMSPFMVTWLSVRSGDALSGLWYPGGLLIMATVIGALFLPEIRNRSLDN